jgi:hypothetical protein
MKLHNHTCAPGSLLMQVQRSFLSRANLVTNQEVKNYLIQHYLEGTPTPYNADIMAKGG